MVQALKEGITRVSCNLAGLDIPLLDVKDETIEEIRRAREKIQRSANTIRHELGSPRVRQAVRKLLPAAILITTSCIIGKVIQNESDARRR